MYLKERYGTTEDPVHRLVDHGRTREMFSTAVCCYQMSYGLAPWRMSPSMLHSSVSLESTCVP